MKCFAPDWIRIYKFENTPRMFKAILVFVFTTAQFFYGSQICFQEVLRKRFVSNLFHELSFGAFFSLGFRDQIFASIN